MSRKIKFRAFDSIGNTYAPNEPKNKMYYDQEFEEVFGVECFPSRHYSKKSRYTFMQFTGLSDKNGKEHYCDDIFDIGQTVNGQSKFVIVDCIGAFDVRYAYDLSRKYEYDINELLDIGKECEYEIISTIHETPELLK